MTTVGRLRVLILGAGSGIAQATARLYAGEGAVIGLAGRNMRRLQEIADESVDCSFAFGCDLTDVFQHRFVHGKRDVFCHVNTVTVRISESMRHICFEVANVRAGFMVLP